MVTNMSGEVIRVSKDRKGAGLTLGKLEYAVFEACCKIGKATVREIMEKLGGDHAYTTVMTTCDRLAKKGVLNRIKCGKSYIYQPVASREEMDVQATCNVLESLIGSMTEPVVANFLDMLEKSDKEKLDLIERMIRERKQDGK